MEVLERREQKSITVVSSYIFIGGNPLASFTKALSYREVSNINKNIKNVS